MFSFFVQMGNNIYLFFTWNNSKTFFSSISTQTSNLVQWTLWQNDKKCHGDGRRKTPSSWGWKKRGGCALTTWGCGWWSRRPQSSEQKRFPRKQMMLSWNEIIFIVNPYEVLICNTFKKSFVYNYTLVIFTLNFTVGQKI